MAIARLIPSTYSVSNTTYLKGTNINNMYANTDSTTYATFTNSQTGTTSYYLYIKGFNFDAIPENAIINSFSIKFKARESGISTSTSYRPILCNNTTTITSTCDVVNTTATTFTFSGYSFTWDTMVGYGSNFGIRLNCRRNSRNTTGYMYVYGAEIVVDYTVPTPRTITTSAQGCTIEPNGTTTVIQGDDLTIKIKADSKPTVTDNGVDVTSSLVEKSGSIAHTVETASGATYGFSMNSNGYYESTNKGRASSTSLCVVSMDLPVECTVKFTLINYAEATYDYGLLSNVDKTLSTSASADTANVYWNGKNNNSASPQTVNYTISAGSHFIYVKYFKDSYTDSNNDTLQFKVDITPNEAYTPDSYWEYILSGISTDHVITASASAAARQMFMKVNNAWQPVTTVYKKINGSWVEQIDIANLFSTDINYIHVQ